MYNRATNSSSSNHLQLFRTFLTKKKCLAHDCLLGSSHDDAAAALYLIVIVGASSLLFSLHASQSRQIHAASIYILFLDEISRCASARTVFPGLRSFLLASSRFSTPMKAFNYEQDLVLERLPGLFPCNVRDSATSFFSDYAIRSFPAFWFLLSLLCLYTWLSLVSFLAKWMDSSDNAMVVKRSLFSRDKVAKSTKGPRKSFDGHAKMKMQESLTSPTEE